MDLLYRGKALYWADVADVAERVLTVDELKGFVDKHAPAPTTPLKPVNPDDYGGQQITPEVQLRELLARRLMRAGRAAEAQAYFDIPNYRRAAQQYADELKAAKDKSAAPLTRAGLLSRRQPAACPGLEFTGYEMTPDYAIYGAGYSYLGDAFDTRELKHKSWIDSAEAARAKAALPAQDNRFLHYRWQAVGLAQQAADLLPPKSQPTPPCCVTPPAGLSSATPRPAGRFISATSTPAPATRGRQNSATTARRRTSPPWRHNAEFQA